MNTMSCRERILSALKCEDIDHTPCCPKFWTGYPRPQAFPWTDKEQRYDWVINELGADDVVYFKVASPEYETVSRRESRAGSPYPVLHSRIETPRGMLKASLYATPDYPYPEIRFFSDWAASRYEKPWIADQEDVEKFASIYLPPGEDHFKKAEQDFKRQKETADRWGMPIIGKLGMALSGIINMMGAEKAVITSMEKPGIIERFLGAMYRRTDKILDMMLSLGVTIFLRNGWYDSTDFWSPRQFSEWVVPQMKKEIESVHNAGGVYIYQMCTGIEPLLPILNKLPFDCLLEPEPVLGNMSMEKLKQSLPGKSFWGGLSAPVHLEKGNEETVREAVREAFRIFGRKGFILKAVPSIRAHLPRGNILAMFDEWKNLR